MNYGAWDSAEKMNIIISIEPYYNDIVQASSNQEKNTWWRAAWNQHQKDYPNRTLDKFQEQWHNLRRDFLARKAKVDASGGGKLKQWPYYEIIDRILRDDPSVDPEVQVDSMGMERGMEMEKEAISEDDDNQSNFDLSNSASYIPRDTSSGDNASSSSSSVGMSLASDVSSADKKRKRMRPSPAAEMVMIMKEEMEERRIMRVNEEKRQQHEQTFRENLLNAINNLASSISKQS